MIKDILAKETKERKPSLVDLYRELLQEPECFPNLSKIIKIALTLPLTSAIIFQAENNKKSPEVDDEARSTRIADAHVCGI